MDERSLFVSRRLSKPFPASVGIKRTKVLSPSSVPPSNVPVICGRMKFNVRSIAVRGSIKISMDGLGVENEFGKGRLSAVISGYTQPPTALANKVHPDTTPTFEHSASKELIRVARQVTDRPTFARIRSSKSSRERDFTIP